MSLDPIKRWVHQGKGLLLPALALPEQRHCVIATGVSQQQEAAQSLHRYNRPLVQGYRGAQQSIVAVRKHLATGRPEFHVWTAVGAGVWLGMEAPVQGVLVFSQAMRAHGKALHRGVWPVVRKGLDYAEARPAVRAVCERIA